MSSVNVSSNLYLVNKLSKEAMVNAAISVGMLTTGYAQDLCPVDTGNLRDSITHAYNDDSDHEVILLVGTNVYYAPYVELGTGIYAVGGNGRKTPWSYRDDDGRWHRTRGMRAQPYLRPAFENHRNEIEQVILNALENAQG